MFPAMDAPGSFAAALLDSSPRALAAGIALRLEGEVDHPFAERVESAENQLRHLAEAVAVSEPGLFGHYNAWLRDAWASRGESTEPLRATLGAVREEFEERLPASVQDALRQALDAGTAALEQEPRVAPSPLEGEGPLVDCLRRFVLALLEGRAEDAVQLVLDEADAGADVSALELEVLAPAQLEVGTLWHRGEIRIAEEHVATAIVQNAAALLRQRIPRPADDARRVAVAAIGTNTHELGARFVSDHFALAGWQTLFLGTDTPPQEIAWAAREFRADAVAVSVALVLQVRLAAQLVRDVRESAPGVPVIVGGGPFAALPDLCKKIGADGSGRTAPEAVSIADALTSA